MTPKRAAWAASVCTLIATLAALWVLVLIQLAFIETRFMMLVLSVTLLAGIACIARMDVIYGLLYGAFRQRGENG